MSDADPPAQQNGSSLARMLRVLDLLSIERPVLTHETITGQLGYTLSSSYRYVRELCSAGLLASIGGGKYALGPRVIELDLQSRLTDPLTVAARDFVWSLLDRIPTGIIALCELRGNRVVSVLTETKPQSHGLNYQRGFTTNLFLGAAAKTILVHLPNRRLSRIYQEFAAEIAAAGMGHDWRSFMKTAGTLRRQPYVLAKGEYTPNNFGLGAPIFYGPGQVAGSLNVGVPLTYFSDELVESLAKPLLEAANAMNARLAEFASAYPPGESPKQS